VKITFIALERTFNLTLFNISSVHVHLLYGLLHFDGVEIQLAA